MVKVAIDITPLGHELHTVRGVGSVIRNLVSAVIKNLEINNHYDIYLVTLKGIKEYTDYDNRIVLDKLDSHLLDKKLLENKISIYYCILQFLPEKQGNSYKVCTLFHDLIPVIFSKQYYYFAIQNEMNDIENSFKPNKNIYRFLLLRLIKKLFGSLGKITIFAAILLFFEILFLLILQLFMHLLLFLVFPFIKDKVKIFYNLFSDLIDYSFQLYLIILKYKKEYYNEYFNKKDWFLKLINNSDYYICISENTRNDLIKIFKADENKCHVVNHGVSINDLEFDEDFEINVLNKYGLQKRKYFYYLGGFDYRKNVKGLIDIFSEYSKMNDDEYKMVIIGKVIKYKFNYLMEDDIIKMANEHGIDNKVVLTGYVSKEELSVLVKNSKLCLFPSLYEGFGLPVLETMRMKKPIVLFENSCMKEVVGDSGYLVKNNSNTKFVKAMNEIINNEKLYNDFKDKAYKRSLTFTWEKSVQKLNEIFNRI